MAGLELVEALLDVLPVEPASHGFGARLDEDSLAAVLDRGEPSRLQGDLDALHVGLVLAVDLRRHGFEAGEADQGPSPRGTVEPRLRSERR